MQEAMQPCIFLTACVQLNTQSATIESKVGLKIICTVPVVCVAPAVATTYPTIARPKQLQPTMANQATTITSTYDPYTKGHVGVGVVRQFCKLIALIAG